MDQEESVNVLDPSGKIGSLPKGQADDAVKNYGFKLASTGDLENYVGQQKYGDQPLKAGALAAAGDATFGGARWLANKTGLVPSEEQAGLAKYNPTATTVGGIAGIVGSLVGAEAMAPIKGIEALVGSFNAAKATGDAVKIAEAARALTAARNTLTAVDILNPVSAVAKVGGKVSEGVAPFIAKATGLAVNPETSAIASKILNKAGTLGAGSAVEGAVYGLGQSITEDALGDPDVNAERVLSNVGYGGLFGGALGAGFGAIGGTYSGIKEKHFTQKLEAQATRDAIAESASYVSTNPTGVPTSLEEIQNRVKQGNYMGLEAELPSKSLLKESVELAGPKNFPVHAVQMESLDSPHMRDLYQSLKESGTKEGQDLMAYEAMQKQELIRESEGLIKSLAPNKQLTRDVVEGGDKVINSFVKADKAEREALKPLFKEFDDLGSDLVFKNNESMLGTLDQSLPGTAQYIKRAEDGSYSLKPYDATIRGLGEETHRELKKVVQALNKNDLTLGGLRGIRENIGKKLNFATNPEIATEVGHLKKGLMDIYQEGIQAANPSLEVREAFKRWAINEQEKVTLEKLVGGKLSDRAELARQIKKEDVLNKIFGNTNAVKSAKQLLSTEDFNEALANYLGSNMEKITDRAKNGFSSNRFSTFLKGKNPELREAFQDNHALLDKLNANTNIMKILPDAPSVNPSGTAKTLGLLERIQSIGSIIAHPSAIPGKILHGISDKFEKGRITSQINKALSEAQAVEKKITYSALSNIERMGQQTANKISAASKNIFKFNEKEIMSLSGYAGSKLTPDQKKKKKDNHEKLAKQINEFYANPAKLMADLEKSTSGLSQAAPQVTQSLHLAAARATSFLASKLPNSHPQSPLSSAPALSETEVSKFERYYSVVQNPALILGQVKSATLTPEGMETIKTVYPKLFTQMQSDVIADLTAFTAKKGVGAIPYKNKMSLSMFLGQDLVDSLKQQNIASNQMSLQGNGAQQAQNQVDQTARISQTGLSTLNKAESALTPMQKSSQRDVES